MFRLISQQTPVTSIVEVMWIYMILKYISYMIYTSQQCVVAFVGYVVRFLIMKDDSKPKTQF